MFKCLFINNNDEIYWDKNDKKIKKNKFKRMQK